MIMISDYKIDPEKVEPKYEQVKNIMLAYIEKLPEEEEYIPYEQVVARELHVGQITVRRAFQELRKEGVIETLRNRGSKVIRNRTSKVNELPGGEGAFPVSTTVAILLPKYDPEATTGHTQWRITHAFERLAAKEGCQVTFYSLCDPKWEDLDKLVENLLENNIRWIYLNQKTNLKNREIAYRLQGSDIKVATFVNSFSNPNSSMLSIPEGVDWVSCNYQEGMYRVLEKNFSGMELIVYVADQNHLSWAQERMKVIELFCNEHGIEYLEIISDIGERKVDTKAVTKDLKPGRNQLFIGANDVVALPILDWVEQLPVDQRRTISVLGFDNTDLARECGLSSFDHNEEGIAENLCQLCRQFHTNKQSPQTSIGRLIYPTYIPRTSVRQSVKKND